MHRCMDTMQEIVHGQQGMPPKKRTARDKGKATDDDEEEEQEQEVTVTIPNGDDDFEENLWDRPFKATVIKYLHRCDAYVVKRAKEGDFMLLPRSMLAEKSGRAQETVLYKLDSKVKTDTGDSVGGDWVEASVLEQLSDGKTLVLQLHDFDPGDWWSSYVVVDKNIEDRVRIT